MLAALTRFLDTKRTKTLAGFGFWILVLKFLRQVTSLGATMALVRALPMDSFGDYQFVLTLIGMSGVFCLSGMQNVIVQSVARGFPGTFRAANRWSWRVSFGGAAVLATAGVWMWWEGNIAAAKAFGVAAFLFPASNGILNWQSFQAGRRQFKATALYQGASLVVGNGLIIIACLMGYQQIWIPIALYFGVLAIQNWRMTTSLLKNVSPDDSVEAGALRYGFRTSLYGVANLLANYLDRILVFALISPEALAVYAVADKIPELLKKNLQSLTLALIPELAEKKFYSPSLNKKFNRAGLVLCLGLIALIFGVIPWAVPLLYTQKFAASVPYCQLLIFSLCLGMFATLKFSYIQAKMDERSFRDVTLMMSGSRILFSLILVPLYGLMGAAIATIAYRVVTFSVVEFYLRKYHFNRATNGGGSNADVAA